MADNIIKVGVDISDNGTAAQLQTKLTNLNKELKSIKNAMRQTSSGMAGSNIPGGISKQENIEYRAARGVAGTGGGDSRDFAKQAQGLGGLVHLYATFAANIFAVSAAFMALDKAAQFTQMIEGAKALESTTGAALRTIADQMKNVTDGALSMQESMRLTALGSAAGLSQKKILELTKGAKGASLALGRDMGDSIDRVIRGVAKLEPELLDELGVVTRAQEAYKKYAQSIGVSATALTSYQKTVAYSTAVSNELLMKFGAISDSVPANPYAKFLGQLKDVGTELLTLVNTVITPVISTLSNNIELMFTGVLLLVKNLTVKAIPEISKMFTVPHSVIAERQAQNALMVESIQKANAAEIVSARLKNAELIQIEKDRVDEIIGINLGSMHAAAKKVFSPKSQIAQTIERDEPLSKSQLGIVSRTIKKATLASEVAGISPEEKASQIARKDNAQAILDLNTRNATVQEASTTKLISIKAAHALAEKDITLQKSLQNGFSQAEKDLAADNLALLKLEKIEAIDTAKYYGNIVLAKKLELEYDEKIALARRAQTVAQGRATPISYNLDPTGKENKNFGIAAGAGVVDFAGKISESTDIVKTKIGNMVSKVGSGLGKIVGFLGTWGVAAMIAYEALSFVADKAGWLNQKTDELNKTLDEGTKVLEAATTSYGQFTKATTASTYSLLALQSANDIASNTFEQGTASIQKQIEVFTAWKEAGGWITSFWDKIGTSKFDTLKENITSQVSIMSKEATGAQAAELKALQERIAGTKDSAEGLQALAAAYVDLESTANRSAVANRNLNSFLKDFQDKANAAGTAIDKINEKEWIKDEKRRTIVEFLKDLQKGLDNVALTADAKINLLAKIPEGLNTAAGKQLEEVRRVAAAIQAITEAVALRQKELSDAQDIYLGKFKNIPALDRTALNIGGIGEQQAQLAIKIGDLNQKYAEENISIEERLKIQSTIALYKLEEEYILSNQRALENKKLESTKKYYEYTALQDEIAASNLRISVSDIFEAPWESIKAHFEWLLLWAEKQTWFGEPPKAPKPEPKTAKDEGLKRLEEENKLLKIQLADLKTPKKIAASMAEQTALGNPAAKDAERQQNQQRMDNLNNQIAAKQKLIELDTFNATQQEKITGLVDTKSILALKDLEISKNALEYSKQELEAKMKFRNTEYTKTADKTQAKTLMEEGIKAAKDAQDFADKKALAVADEKINSGILSNYKRQQGLQDSIALDKSKEIVSIAKDLGQLSAQEVLDKEYANNLQSLTNRENELNYVKSLGYLNDIQKLELDTISRAKVSLASEKSKNDILEARAALQRKFGTDQESIQQKIDAGLKNNTSTVQLEVDLIQQKIAETKRLNIENGQDGKELERNLALQKDILAFLERQHEAKKRDFMAQDNKPQIIYDEAAKRARDFAASMKDTVTGTFDAIYSGMDAAIDDITTKLMNGTKIQLKDVVDLFRNTVAEGFRSMAAEQLKSSARNLIKDAVSGVAGMFGVKLDMRTNEEKAIDYAKRTAEGIEKIVNGDISSPSKDGTTAGPGILDRVKSLFGFGQTGAGGFENYSNAPDTSAMTTEAATAANEAYYGAMQDSIDATDELSTKAPDLWSKISGGFGSLFGSDGIVMKLLGGLGSGISGIFQSIFGMFTGGGVGGGGGFGDIFSSIGGLFSGGGMGDMMGSLLGTSGVGGYLSGLFFANGGIMSEYGAMKLNKYAGGGVANSPQMAVYGEGRQPEAYVPLPDGRTIPVTMQGGNSGSGPINVTVNVDAKGNADTQTTGATNAQDAKQLGIIISSKVREEIVNQQRSGGLLNKR